MPKYIKYLNNGEYKYASVKDVGDLLQLKTSSKDDIVSAINEIIVNGVSAGDIGDGLTTEDIVNIINDSDAVTDINKDVANIVSEIQATKDQFNNDTDQLRKELQERMDAVKADIQKVIDDYQVEQDKKNKEQAENIVNLQNESTQVKNDLAGTKEDLEGIRNELLDDFEHLGKQDEDIEKIKGDLNDTNSNLGKVSSDLANTQNDIQTSVENINKDIQNTNTNIGNVSKDLNDTKGNLDVVSNEVKNNKKDIVSINESINGITTDVANTKGDVTELKQTATQLSSSIKDNKDNITSVKQTATRLSSDMENAKGDISSLQQTAEGLSSTVADTNSKVDNLQIGGRNYFIEGTLIGSTNIDDTTGKLVSAGTSWTTTDWVSVDGDTEYTWQAPDFHHTQRIYEYDSDKKFIQLDKSKWNEFVYTIKTQPNTKYVRIVVQVALDTIVGNTTTQLYKFEKGNKKTDWSPAPEDMATVTALSKVEQKADSISSTVTNNKKDADNQFTNINQTISGIQSTVKGHGNEISRVEQTANGLKTDVTNAKGDITQLQQTTSEIQTTVKNHSGDLSNIKQDATQIKSDIKNAKGDISSIKQTAQTMQSNISDNKDNISTIQQDAKGIKSDVADAKGNITKLQQTASGLQSSVENLDTELTNNSSQIKKNTTDISQNKKDIQLKAEQKSLDLLKGDVSKNTAALKVANDKIEAKVSREELVNEIDNFDVKKANLFTGTREWQGWEESNSAEVVVTDQKDNFGTAVEFFNVSDYISLTVDNLEVGKTYTISVSARSDKNTDGTVAQAFNIGEFKAVDTKDTFVGTTLQRYFVNVVATDKTMTFKLGAKSLAKQAHLFLSKAKLETGTKATMWEDNANDSYARIEKNDADLKVLSDRVTSTVSKQTQTDSKVTKNTTDIAQTAKKIEANIKELKDQDGRITENKSQITATANGLRTEFTQKTNDAIGAITDGGKNLILSSAFQTDPAMKNWQSVNNKVVVKEKNSQNWAYMSQSGLSADSPIGLTSNYFAMKANDPLVIAFDIIVGDVSKLDNKTVLEVRYYDKADKRVDFKDYTLTDLGIKSPTSGETNRAYIKINTTHDDVVKGAILPRLSRNGEVWMSNFFAKISSISNGDYEVANADLEDMQSTDHFKLEQTAQGLTGKADTTQLNKLSGDLTTLSNNFSTTSAGFNASLSKIDDKVNANKEETDSALSVAKADIKATADNLSTNYTKTTDEHKYVNSQIKQSADKINLSVASVSDKVDGMEIGGRNLIIASKTAKGAVTDDGSFNTFDGAFHTDYIPVTSKYVTTTQPSSGENYSRFAEYDSDKKFIKRTLIQSEKIHTWSLDSKTAYVIWSPDAIDGQYKEGYKLESGNKATDWAPALEDTDSKIAALQIDADGIKQTVSNKADTSYVDQKANQITSTVGNKADISYVDQQDKKIQSTVASKADASQITQLSNQINLKVSQTDFDNLTVGGQNIVPNSGDPQNTSGWSTNDTNSGTGFGVIKHDFFKGGTRNMFVIGNSSSTKEFYIRSSNIYLQPDRDYTLSFDVFNDGNMKNADVYFIGDDGPKLLIQYKKWSTAGDTRESITFNSGKTKRGHVRFDNNCSVKEGTKGNLFIGDVTLVQGNKPSAWSPAESDLTTADNVVSQINIDKSGVLISGNKVHITGATTIDNAAIEFAKIKNVKISDAMITSLGADKLDVSKAKIGTGKNTIDMTG